MRVSGSGALVFYLFFPWRIQWMLALPGLIALGYVLPLGASGKRLRDLHFLKIFLLAIVWAWITVWLPAAELQADMQKATLWMGLERAAYTPAYYSLRHPRPRGGPAYAGQDPSGGLGIVLVLALALLMLIAMLLFAGMNAYSTGVWAGLACSAAASFLLILFARRVQHDYYFSGLLDGMMILQFLLVLAGARFLT